MSRPTALLLAAAALSGCGPVMATSVVDDAEVALARAHASEGEKYALYETTLADLYLIKAKEEQGHARYSGASQLGAEALKYAETATRKAAERRTSAAAPPTPTATVQHPVEPPAAPAPNVVKRPADAVPPPSQATPAPPPVPPEKQPAPEKRPPKSPIDPGQQQ